MPRGAERADPRPAPTTSPCPVCLAPDAAKTFTKREISYFACRGCGFAFSTPPVNANLANRLDDFEEVYLAYLGPNQADERNFDDLAGWMSRYASLEGASLLDVGCGSGKLVRYLRRRAVAAWGVEPSRALYDHFLARDPEFFRGTLDEVAAARDARFDVVTAFDVLEHVPDPLALLRALARTTRDGGTVLVSTPDVGSPTARLLGRWWPHYNRYHLSYLSRPALERLAAQSGLRLLDCSRRGRYRSIGYAIAHVLEFVSGVSRPNALRHLDGVYLPINTFDVMHAALRKPGPDENAIR